MPFTFSFDINITTVLVALGSAIAFYLIVVRMNDRVTENARVIADTKQSVIELKTNVESGYKAIAIERDSDMRAFGETVHALREKLNSVELVTVQKVSQIEIWARDEFVRRSSFSQFLERISREQEAWRIAFDERMGRIETKIDRLAEARK